MDVAAYLVRIGATRAPRPSAEALAALQVAHLMAVPFETLDIGLRRPISLAPQDIFEKIVAQRRGGFCYELNGLFAQLLGALGYRVTMLSARTVDEDGAQGPEFDHLVLRVDLDEPSLVDVGFGDTFREPLRLIADEEQADSLGRVHRLDVEGDDWILLERRGADGPWLPQYRFTLEPRTFDEFEPMCRWQQTEARYFTEHRLCSVGTPDGRITLYDDRLIVHAGGTRTETQVEESDIGALLRDRFGVDLGPEAATTTVAVYGTLRRGQRNHRLLGAAVFLGAGFVEGTVHDVPRTPYRDYAYPALVEAPAGRVAVEVFRMAVADVLSKLDPLERFYPGDEANSQYVRRTVKVLDGPVLRADAYFYHGAPVELGEAVAGGDWVAYERARAVEQRR
jgi:N-hydroxyarylamine O-acetyltransferase